MVLGKSSQKNEFIRIEVLGCKKANFVDFVVYLAFWSLLELCSALYYVQISKTSSNFKLMPPSKHVYLLEPCP
jgi:hypothetical protein